MTPRCSMLGTMDCKDGQEGGRGDSHTKAGAWAGVGGGVGGPGQE